VSASTVRLRHALRGSAPSCWSLVNPPAKTVLVQNRLYTWRGARACQQHSTHEEAAAHQSVTRLVEVPDQVKLAHVREVGVQNLNEEVDALQAGQLVADKASGCTRVLGKAGRMHRWCRRTWRRTGRRSGGITLCVRNCAAVAAVSADLGARVERRAAAAAHAQLHAAPTRDMRRNTALQRCSVLAAGAQRFAARCAPLPKGLCTPGAGTTARRWPARGRTSKEVCELGVAADHQAVGMSKSQLALLPPVRAEQSTFASPGGACRFCSRIRSGFLGATQAARRRGAPAGSAQGARGVGEAHHRCALRECGDPRGGERRKRAQRRAAPAPLHPAAAACTAPWTEGWSAAVV
jgi:hypothetical protein